MAESSGCGSNMNFPSLVRFTSGCRNRDEWREPREALREGPYADGRDDADVRARACCRPSGSLRLCAFERRITDPTMCQSELRDDARTPNVPGTSSVRGSLKIPRFHFLLGAESLSFWGVAGGAALFSSAGAGCFREPPRKPMML